MTISKEQKQLHETLALCPMCLKELPAKVYADADSVVWMERTCAEHGIFTTRIWPEANHYSWLRSLSFPKTTPDGVTSSDKPCPFSCGLCGRHERRSTLLEIEVTQKCNLRCPVCFMSAEDGEGDPSIEEIDDMYEAIITAVGADGAVQITGGEPTCRGDLADIISLGREKGFWGIEINTNGLVIASRDGYLEKLVEAGLTGVYLSFDGLTGDVYETTCGRDILKEKLKVVERCREAGVQCVLAMTIIAGVNDEQLGDVLRFCLDNADTIAGLALQPAFTSGRFSAQRAMPMSMGDVIFYLAEQSQGLIEASDMWPLGCSNPLCSTGTFLVQTEDPETGVKFTPATHWLTLEEYQAEFNPSSPQGSIFLDILARKGVYVSSGLSIIIMNYMDAASMDIQRLRECSMVVVLPDGRSIPFCSYHLTDLEDGRRIYPPWGKPELYEGKFV